MDGRTEIREKLLADATVVSLVGTFEGQPAIFDAPLTPQKYTDAAISMYQTSPTVGGLEYGQIQNTVNCWATSYTVAENMQDAVLTALNRVSENGVFFVPFKQVIIPPQETGGDYNAPVEVTTKYR